MAKWLSHVVWYYVAYQSSTRKERLYSAWLDMYIHVARYKSKAQLTTVNATPPTRNNHGHRSLQGLSSGVIYELFGIKELCFIGCCFLPIKWDVWFLATNECSAARNKVSCHVDLEGFVSEGDRDEQRVYHRTAIYPGLVRPMPFQIRVRLHVSLKNDCPRCSADRTSRG